MGTPPLKQTLRRTTHTIHTKFRSPKTKTKTIRTLSKNTLNIQPCGSSTNTISAFTSSWQVWSTQWPSSYTRMVWCVWQVKSTNAQIICRMFMCTWRITVWISAITTLTIKNISWGLVIVCRVWWLSHLQNLGSRPRVNMRTRSGRR